MASDFDVLIVGSGFGGSTTALRLTEKGYKVGVLEAGRRFEDDELPKTSWDIRKFLWAPALGCYGIQRIHPLNNVLVLAGAGVGGGSLNYANTLYVPPEPFFADPQWRDITNWREELTPHYEQATKMLGVVQNTHQTYADKILQDIAEEMGVGDSYVQTPVGVFFGEPGKTVPDPFFGGAGPDRTGCIECGDCMVGCKYNAKNTLVKNYLYLAEGAGAEVFPLTMVDSVEPQSDGSWVVQTHRTGAKLRRRRQKFTARHVVLAAGTRGTQKLLFTMRDAGKLPQLSERLGVLTRTNSESILGASRSDGRQGPRLHRGRCDHVVHPPERRHPHRERPLRKGFELDGVPAGADGRRRRLGSALVEAHRNDGRSPAQDRTHAHGQGLE